METTNNIAALAAAASESEVPVQTIFCSEEDNSASDFPRVFRGNSGNRPTSLKKTDNRYMELVTHIPSSSITCSRVPEPTWESLLWKQDNFFSSRSHHTHSKKADLEQRRLPRISEKSSAIPTYQGLAA